MIPLRPELIEFLTAESLGRLSCSKALRTEVRETNAWRLLAAVQCPPRTTHVALEERVNPSTLRRTVLGADHAREHV